MTDDGRTPEPAGAAAPLPPPDGRAWLALALGAIILICGMAIGVGATVLWRRGEWRRPGPRVGAFPAHMVEHLRERYGLTEEQTRKARELFERSLKALHGVRRRMLPLIKAEHEKLRKEMRTILTPEQYERWSKDFGERQRRWFRSGSGPGRGRFRGRRRPGPPRGMPGGADRAGKPRDMDRREAEPKAE